MSIHLLTDRCRGCGACVEACPGNLLTQGPDGKAVLSRPQDCWGCTACVKLCPAGALRYYLGADMGGLGGEMYTVREGPLLHWRICRPDGENVTITVDSRDANRY